MVLSMQAAMVAFIHTLISPPAAQRPSLFGQSLGTRDQSLFRSSFANLPSPRRLLKINGCAASANPTPAPSSAATTISRKDFPTDFLFGAGCSAFQIEGAPTAGGRGNTIWDSFSHIPGPYYHWSPYAVHQHGVVGFNPCHFGAKPYSDKMEDKLATERYLEFFSGWQIDPVVFGHYPMSMRAALGERLPQFTQEESEDLRNSCDFLGHNVFSAFFIQNADVPKDPSLRWYDNDGGNIQTVINERGEYIGEHTGTQTSWIYNCAAEVPPLLEWLEARYGKIPCYIMENGTMDKTPTNAIGALEDQERITYLANHLMYLSKAIKEKGINVVGYVYWSFLDVFEWDGGNNA